jgi:hypothetical protein
LKHEIDNSSWNWIDMERIAREVAPRVRHRRDLRKRIALLPPFFEGQSANNADLLSAFGSGCDGQQVTEEILGLWLGDFDLVVIDEAHKGRGEVDVDGTALGAIDGSVLARLVEKVLKQREGGRRLCLTATPMELELSQWLDLLAGARSGLDPERGRQVVQRLHDAAERAAVAQTKGPGSTSCARLLGTLSGLSPRT